MHPKKLALPVAAALLLLAAAAGAATPAATPLGWYGDACDDAEAQNPGAPGGCRYDIRESELPGAFGLASCADGVDNDGDTYADCADADCAGDPACAGACNSDAPENCTDGQDDDCDGLADCADGDCAYYCATYGNPGNPGDPENGNAGNGRGMHVDQEPGTEDYGSCGNGICEVGEEGKCLDCVVCNDGTCDPDFESYFTCPGDCPNTPSCGDGKCELLGGETTTNCSEDCGSRCGDGRCDAFTTPLGGTFEDSESCPEDCYGGDCGNGNCEYLRGETTETCSLDCKPFCGNLHCEEGENKTNCEQDCGSGTSCGDGFCDPSRNEDAQTCREDCGYYCGDGYCHPQINEDEVSCPPDCYVPQMRDPEGNPV
jgi:hypothetical protein